MSDDMREPDFVALLPDDLAAYCRETSDDGWKSPRWQRESAASLSLLILVRILATVDKIAKHIDDDAT